MNQLPPAVAPVATTQPEEPPTSAGARVPALIRASYAVLAVLLAAYFVSLLARTPEQHSLLVDGWLVGLFELVASMLCFARAFQRLPQRSIVVALGAAVLSWSIGDLILSFESIGGASPPTPSAADLFYLGFYPLTYVAIALVLRRQVVGMIPATWLDGAVAGLGAATVCATFAFRSILQSIGGDPLAVATNLAYPVGDLLLLVLVVGGTAVLPTVKRTQWLLIACACALNAVGDTFNLLHSGGPESHLGSVFDGIAWPAAILMISIAVWLRPTHRDPLAPERAPRFTLPGLGALAGLAVLFIGTTRPIGELGIILATATLVTVGVRLALSVRGLRALTEERQTQAVTDELTGLGNRRRLFNVLNAFFADLADPRIAPRQLAFLFVDLNHFKEVNDSFGHSAGDELLRQLGPRLSGCLRESDVLVRLGGDELGVVLIDTNPVFATTVAERLSAKLEEPFTLHAGVKVRISASIGIATAPGDAVEPAALLHCADVAMYRAKLERSAIEVYHQRMEVGGDRLRLVEDLRTAVERGEFVLHYQPLVDLRTGEITAMEALLRWPHPRLGVIPPLEFLPLAEEAGLMHALTGVVLSQAFAQCTAWRSAGEMLRVSVNISASNLHDRGFLKLVEGLLTTHKLEASAVILEVTETTIIANLDECKGVIAALRALGVGVSIDDFGAGFTSLAYLGGLAANELKLDRAFIIGLGGEGRERDLALVRSTIELGHALGLRVVAEGIEDEATFELLAGIGCDLAQGYFISRPMPAADVALRRELAG